MGGGVKGHMYKAIRNMQYKREEKLNIYRRIGVTKPVYAALRKQKKKVKLSMAKLICNLVLKTYTSPQESQEDTQEKDSNG